MKYLQEYQEAKQTDLFNSTGAFFAFSMKQFNEQKQSGTKYVNCGHGMLCPKPNVDALIDGLGRINKEAIKKDIAENGIKAIIRRELYNYECFYTGDMTDAINALKSYNITNKQIREIYAIEYPKADL